MSDASTLVLQIIAVLNTSCLGIGILLRVISLALPEWFYIEMQTIFGGQFNIDISFRLSITGLLTFKAQQYSSQVASFDSFDRTVNYFAQTCSGCYTSTARTCSDLQSDANTGGAAELWLYRSVCTIGAVTFAFQIVSILLTSAAFATSVLRLRSAATASTIFGGCFSLFSFLIDFAVLVAYHIGVADKANPTFFMTFVSGSSASSRVTSLDMGVGASWTLSAAAMALSAVNSATQFSLYSWRKKSQKISTGKSGDLEFSQLDIRRIDTPSAPRGFSTVISPISSPPIFSQPPMQPSRLFHSYESVYSPHPPAEHIGHRIANEIPRGLTMQPSPVPTNFRKKIEDDDDPEDENPPEVIWSKNAVYKNE